MCGRYANSLPPDAIRALFATVGDAPNIGPSWNMAPTQPAMVVRRHPQTGQRRLDLLAWGLVPHFTRDLKAARKPINIRSETAATSGLSRGAFAQRRCLVPAEAFYEWLATPTGKQPYAIARVDSTPIAFAGLWEGWRSPAGETLRSFAILTTAANHTLRFLHERMPVLLEPRDWPAWLGETPGDPTQLMKSADDDTLRLWPVSTKVSNVRNNGPDLLEALPPVPAGELNPL